MKGTPSQTDSDVTYSRSCDQGEVMKKDWKTGMQGSGKAVGKKKSWGQFKRIKTKSRYQLCVFLFQKRC